MADHLSQTSGRTAGRPSRQLTVAWAGVSFAASAAAELADPSSVAARDQQIAAVAERLSGYGVDLDDASTRNTLVAATDLLGRVAVGSGSLQGVLAEMARIQQGCRQAALRTDGR